MSVTETVAEVETEEIRGLTAFQRNILIVLTEEPTYGLGIKRELEDYYGEEVNHGRLYPNLDELVEMGLVEKSELDKRTNEYALTDAGYAAVGDQLEWTVERLLSGDESSDGIDDLVEQHS